MSLLCALMPLAASAYDFEVDGLYFNKTNEGEVEVVKGDKQYSGDVHAVMAKRMSISRIHLLFMATKIRINQEKTKEIT